MPADAIVSIITFAVILLIFYGPWQETCTDIGRHLIFVRRDKLFNIAQSGKIRFDSREYKAIRSGLESFIRYAHTLTWPQFLVFNYLIHDNSSRDDHEFYLTDAVNSIEDEETKKQVRRIVIESSYALIVMMALKSIFTAPLTVAFIAFAVCTKTVSLFMDNLKFAEHIAMRLARRTQEAEHDARRLGAMSV